MGSLVGVQARNSSIFHSYSTGKLASNGDWSSGIVGDQHTNSKVVGSYYDIETTEVVDKDTNKGEGKTTKEMKNPLTYKGWDQSIWVIKDGSYPKLQWQ